MPIRARHNRAPTTVIHPLQLPEQQSHEIVFIDDGVDDYQQLVDDIYRQSDSGRNIEVVILDQ